MGGSSWPALPGEPARQGRPGEEPVRSHPDRHPEQHGRQRPELQADRERVADHHPHDSSGQLPEQHARRLPDQQRTDRYRGPAEALPHHARPDRDRHAGVRFGQRGGEVGWWDGPPAYGTDVTEVDDGGRWPVDAAFPSAPGRPGVDPWPALPDDGPLWTVPGTALDADHERRLDREQAGG